MLHTIQNTLFMLIGLVSLFGCTASAPREVTNSPAPRSEVIALIGSRAITIADLQRQMSEIAGDEALSEYVLDLALRQRCQGSGIVVTREDRSRERMMLSEMLSDVDERALNSSVIETLRVRRGLGPDRFERLLDRNAMLRALVSDAVEPSSEAISRARQEAFGERYRVLLFVSQRPEPATELHNRALEHEGPARFWVFAEGCRENSIHPSAARSGQISNISSLSAGYPSAVLESIQTLEPGGCSEIISTEAGYALVLLEQVTPAITPSDKQNQDLIEQLKRNNQRLAMQRLAQKMLDEHEVIVLDQSLNWAWTNRQ